MGILDRFFHSLDGPVTFDGRKNKKHTDFKVKSTNPTDSTGATSGALVVTGGVGIGKNVNIGGSMFFPDDKKYHFW